MRVKVFGPAIFALIIALVISNSTYAASDLELPPEELAKETVLPVFDRVEMVRVRKVKTAGKWEVAGIYSWMMSEPIFDTSRLGISAYKHTSEETAWGAQFYYYSTGLSDYAKQLKKEFQLDYTRAPKPEYGFFVDYNMKLFYGKMSITKNTTMNTHLLGLFSVGMTKYENKMYPGVTGGVGYKFYFTPAFSLRTDLRLFIHQAPIPFKRGAIVTGDPVPSKSSFKDRIHYTNLLDISLNWLF
jgi:outer membrane beta-barrel protein